MTDLTTHLLGYLKPRQWADAVKNTEYSNKEIAKLLEKQEQAYPTNIKSEVEQKIEGELP